MRRVRNWLSVLLSVIWLACSPAPLKAVPAAWGGIYAAGPIVIQLGTATHGGVSSLVLTTTADAPSHSTIIVFGGAAAATVTFAITDANGDTFTEKHFAWNTVNNAGVSYVVNTASDLPSGSSITLTPSAQTDVSLVAIDVIALNGGADVTGSNVGGSGTSTSVSTGALAQASELVCGATYFVATPGTWTEASGFTSETQATANAFIFPACKIVTSTASVTYAPSWVNSHVFAANVWSWKSP